MIPLNVGVVISDRTLLNEVQGSLRDLPVRIVMEQPEVSDWNSFAERIDVLRPDVVVIELTGLWENLEPALQRIRRTSASPAIFGIHHGTDPESILRAIRAGATEYLYPPVATSLLSGLERVSEAKACEKAQFVSGKAIGFFSAKGGCGATTVASHTALELQKASKQKVLVADFDLDSGMLGFLFKSKSQYTVLDAIGNLNRLDHEYWKALVSNGIPGIEVVAAPAAAPNWQAGEQDRLRPVLRFTKSVYNWVVTDLGRGIGPNVLSLLEEMDSAFLVTTVDVPSLYRSRQIVKHLSDSGYDPAKLQLVLNRVPRRTDVTVQEVEGMMKVPVAAVLHEDSEAVYEAYAEGRFLPQASALGRRIAELAGRIAGVQATPLKQKKKFPFLG